MYVYIYIYTHTHADTHMHRHTHGPNTNAIKDISLCHSVSLTVSGPNHCPTCLSHIIPAWAILQMLICAYVCKRMHASYTFCTCIDHDPCLSDSASADVCICACTFIEYFMPTRAVQQFSMCVCVCVCV